MNLWLSLGEFVSGLEWRQTWRTSTGVAIARCHGEVLFRSFLFGSV